MKHENNGLIDSDCFMTRRDQVAALAMQGLLSHYWIAVTSEELAQDAVRIADALLWELDKSDE